MTQSLKSFLLAKPVERSLAAQLRRAIVRSIVMIALLAAPVLGAQALPGAAPFGVGDLDVRPSSPIAVEAGEPSKAQRLVERHDCWTGEAPTDVEPGTIPGGVVMSLAGQGPRFYSADDLVGKALDHLFASPDPQVVAIFGFCR